MGHTIAEKEKLLVRVRALKAQLADIEAALKAAAAPGELLPKITESRGLINGLMADVIEDHIRVHMLQDWPALPAQSAHAAEDLIVAVHSYMGQ